MRFTHQNVASFILLATLAMVGCREAELVPAKVEPAHVERGKNHEVTRITLTEKALERLGVQTAPIRDGKVEGTEAATPHAVVADSAVIYIPTGETFVYTSPSPNTFVRQAVDIDHIEGGVAVLKQGPPVGTQVVTVGAVELFGTEFGVGH